MRILGIETSCDETAAAVVEAKAGGKLRILSNVVASQIDIHREFGGVVPEVAARSHLEVILPAIEKAVQEAVTEKRAKGRKSDPWDQIDGIAVTYGPGLPGALLIGVETVKALALVKAKPLYPVDHVHAHVYANWLGGGPSKSEPKFPLLALIVSGGHTQLVLFNDHFNYKVLGQTLDDAVGEAFDKVAKLLGLGFPGGPEIAKAALKGDPSKYSFPIAKLKNPYDFSFSGLKTAVLRHLQNLVHKDYAFPSYKLSPLLNEHQINDTAASFEANAVKALVSKALGAYQQYQPRSVVIAGGVAANQKLREQLSSKLGSDISYAPPELCTDNAAMIAALAWFQSKNKKPIDPLKLETNPSLSM